MRSVKGLYDGGRKINIISMSLENNKPIRISETNK